MSSAPTPSENACQGAGAQGELKAARSTTDALASTDQPDRGRNSTVKVSSSRRERTGTAQPGAGAGQHIRRGDRQDGSILTDLPTREAAQVNPGDNVELVPEDNRLIAISNSVRIGVVEPRVAARLLKLIADGNKYAAGVTSLGDKDVRIILREIFQDPANYGKVSFPTAAKSTDLRPYTKGTLVREEMDLEDDLEDDEEDEEIEDLDRVLPPESTSDEAFEDEPDELDEP